MRFYMQRNVLCLAYKHPLLLDCSRGWASKNHLRTDGNPQCPHPENGGALTTVEPDEIYRFEGEGGLEASGPAVEWIAISLENAMEGRPAAP
jgi:hypothetical protein